MPLKHPPTPEQSAILAAGRDSKASLLIHAYAGTGKTTTLTMLAEALPKQPSLALAFNVRIKKSLEKMLPSHFEVKTLNGLGHIAWKRAINKSLTLDENKLGRLVTQAIKQLDIYRGEETWTNIRKLVSLAQNSGIVPVSFPQKGLLPDTPETWVDLAEESFHDYSEETIDAARLVLRLSVEEAFSGTISYDDQIYQSALFGGQFPKFPLVMTDESQDFSVLNIKMLRSCATGRLVIVGDEKQAVYSFRGASGHAMELIRKLREEWIDLPLATTFRCPKAIVARQQRHAPGFAAHENNAQGLVVAWTGAPGAPGPAWDMAKIRAAAGPGETAFLCRNNAPLLKVAFRLIADGVGCSMLGRDIGKNLESLSKKILTSDDIPPDSCAKLILDWATSQISLAQANGHESKISGLQDRRDCLLAVLESTHAGPCKTSGELRRRLRDIFSEGRDSRIILSSIHRSKGLEWPTVVHLDPWRLPSRHARKAYAAGNPVPLTQERNLAYVCETRAMRTLILADTEVYGLEEVDGSTEDHLYESTAASHLDTLG
jgi:superfamily I DNA/RNA helicase